MTQRKESPKLYFMNDEKRVHVFDIWQILLKGKAAGILVPAAFYRIIPLPAKLPHY
jgi:hypothetical protein